MRSSTVPYIGVTGITTVSEAEATARFMDTHLSRASIPHLGAIGVLVNDATLHGRPTDNLRCPPLHDVPKILKVALRANFEVLTVIHYTCKEPYTLFEGVKAILDFCHEDEGDPLCSAIQLNGGAERVWETELKRIKEAYPATKIIYQLPAHDLRSADDAVVEEVERKIQWIDHILIDPSGGRGELFDLTRLRPCIAALRERFDGTLGFAGGLNGDNVALMLALFSALLDDPCFSVDAERGLRRSLGPGYGNDTYDPWKAEHYFSESVRGFSELPTHLSLPSE